MKRWTIDDIRAANGMRGHFFFSSGAMRGFKSRVSSTVYQGPGGVYFVTSERFVASNGWSPGRDYSVRRFDPATGSVYSVGGHQMPGEGMARGRAHREAARLAGKWPSDDLRRRFRFFHEEAGYVVGERAVGALNLARAEIKAEKLGVLFEWDYDDMSWDGDGPVPSEVLVCRMMDCGRTVRSLCGIGDPSREYRRVVEAELAAEVFTL